jgi:hypothetical protein
MANVGTLREPTNVGRELTNEELNMVAGGGTSSLQVGLGWIGEGLCDISHGCVREGAQDICQGIQLITGGKTTT